MYVARELSDLQRDQLVQLVVKSRAPHRSQTCRWEDLVLILWTGEQVTPVSGQIPSKTGDRRH